jgi:hypothetical protein
MQTRKEFCKNCLMLALAGAGVPLIFGSQQKDGKPAAQSAKKGKMIAYCGIACSDCEAYIATQKNDDALRAKTAKEWSEKFKIVRKPEDINCDGCPTDSQRIVQYCKICDIRKCARDKKLSSCAACSTYPCEKLSKFLAGAPEAKKTLEALRQGKA